MSVVIWCFFFFFKQKTAYEIGTGDWSSDVCSSDLPYTTIILAVYPLGLQIIKVLFFYLCVLDETTVYYDVYTDSGSWLYKCM